MEWTAIVNPTAGRTRSRATVETIRAALRGAGVDAEVVASADAADGEELARKAAADGRGVIACGGDGTVAALAGVLADATLAGSPATFAFLPTGSGNDFARHLGIPLDLDAAARVVGAGHVADVDLGLARTADGTARWFTTVANTGFDAEANRWANGVRRLRGTPLYVTAALRTLASYRPRALRITVDGNAQESDAWLVAIGNASCYGGGMRIAPDASTEDGLLDVCLVGSVSRTGFLRAFPKVFRGRHTTHPAVTLHRGAEVLVEAADGRPGELWASGERVGPLPARIEARPRAIRLVVPRA
jgi:diacylglycerol kinase (ATP)